MKTGRVSQAGAGGHANKYADKSRAEERGERDLNKRSRLDEWAVSVTDSGKNFVFNKVRYARRGLDGKAQGFLMSEVKAIAEYVTHERIAECREKRPHGIYFPVKVGREEFYVEMRISADGFPVVELPKIRYRESENWAYRGRVSDIGAIIRD